MHNFNLVVINQSNIFIMKKLFLMTAIGVASFMNAKTISPKIGSGENPQKKKDVILKNEKKSALSTKNTMEMECRGIKIKSWGLGKKFG